jgi:hypothetical protein
MNWKLPPRTPAQITRDLELQSLIEQSIAAVNAMTPEEREKMHAAQRESFVRAMMPYGYEHSLEWCEVKLIEVEKKIAEATCWGGYLSELQEDAQDLTQQIARKRREIQQQETLPHTSS